MKSSQMASTMLLTTRSSWALRNRPSPRRSRPPWALLCFRGRPHRRCIAAFVSTVVWGSCSSSRPSRAPWPPADLAPRAWRPFPMARQLALAGGRIVRDVPTDGHGAIDSIFLARCLGTPPQGCLVVGPLGTLSCLLVAAGSFVSLVGSRAPSPTLLDSAASEGTVRRATDKMHATRRTCVRENLGVDRPTTCSWGSFKPQASVPRALRACAPPARRGGAKPWRPSGAPSTPGPVGVPQRQARRLWRQRSSEADAAPRRRPSLALPKPRRQ